MATHKSAEKRHRQSEKRRLRNQGVRSRMRTTVKNFLASLDSGDAEAATANFRSAERELRKAATKGVIPKQRADRHVGRLSKRLQSLRSS
ncbi:MAG: 30S ribosomal protein S20 [Myxococcota bacterium]|nr:30S ribosomal protein S20 [Myxococcota bacterium]